MTLEKLPGDPAAVAARADGLSHSAKRIQEAAEALFALSFAGTGDALDTITEKADELADKVKATHGRYAGTAAALSTYAVELQAAHNKANDAIDTFNNGARYAGNAEDEMRDLKRQRDLIEEADPNDPRLQQADDDMRDLAGMRDNYERQQHDAEAKRAQAQHDLDEAAERAMRAIDSAMSDTNDGFWDHVGDFFANIGEALAAIAKWIGEVLKTIIAAILIAILAVVALLIVVVLLAALIKWLILVAPLLLIIGGLLLLTFLIPGLEGWRTQLLAILLGVAIPLVGGLLLWRVLSDITAPDPVVTPLEESDLSTQEQRDARDDALDIPGMYTLKDYMEAEGLTDSMGKDETGVVDIRKVVGPDGVERWVVTLPSTQDWLIEHGDTGATNDLDSNLALMLTPEQQTQYERAVLDAMKQAGIGKDDPVMLVGFSQGGIMAGHLAANRSSEFNFDALLVYGAPIDAMNIPESTRVLSIQHTGDAVPMLDLTDPKPNTANHVTVQVDANDGTIGVGSHANDKYHDTAAYSPELQQYQDYFSDFSGTVVDQQQYTWHE
jgi:hypothetical protein